MRSKEDRIAFLQSELEKETDPGMREVIEETITGLHSMDEDDCPTDDEWGDWIRDRMSLDRVA